MRDKPADSSFFINGRSAVLEFARHRPECLLEVFATKEQTASLGKELVSMGLEFSIGVPPAQVAAEAPVGARIRLSMMREVEFFNRLEAETVPLIVAADHITDPRNLGAIVRSCAFYGVPFVVVPDRRQVLLTTASVSTSKGGFARVELVPVVNLSRTLDQLKKVGFWVVGADMSGAPVDEAAADFEKTILVVGSEDRGLSANVTKRCDLTVSIVGPRGQQGLDSLNVSVASGIILHSLTRKIPREH